MLVTVYNYNHEINVTYLKLGLDFSLTGRMHKQSYKALRNGSKGMVSYPLKRTSASETSVGIGGGGGTAEDPQWETGIQGQC